MGDSIATNMFMLGYAWQKGRVPLAEASLMQRDRTQWRVGRVQQGSLHLGPHRRARPRRGRRSSTTPAQGDRVQARRRSLDDVVKRRVELLTAYQNAAYAAQYTRVRRPGARRRSDAGQAATRLTEAVARYFFKLMAYKDEYEVARLHTDAGLHGKDRQHVRRRLSRIKFHLAPPLFAKHDTEGHAGQAGIRPVDDEGVRRAGQAEGPARHARSTSSATPPSARPSAR